MVTQEESSSGFQNAGYHLRRGYQAKLSSPWITPGPGRYILIEKN